MYTHKPIKQFIPTLRKFFTNQKVVLEKKALSVNVEYKPFYFKYQGLNFKSDIPINMPMTIKDFLNHFSKERSVGLENSASRSYKDYDIVRNDKYLPLEIPIVDMNTQMKDANPVWVYESKLTHNNIQFRGNKHLKNPIETHSSKLQEHFNNFLEQSKIDKTKLNKDDLLVLLNSLSEINGNESKIAMVVACLINKLNTFERKGTVTFHSNQTIEAADRNPELNVYLLKDSLNHNQIPLTIAVGGENQLNHAIVKNFDTLRNISRKYKTKTNFGIVTNLSNWKFNLYLKPEDDKLEKEENFLTSLPYKLSISESHLGTESYLILLKIIDGISKQNPKEDLNLEE